jgi:hypothetical protein
MPPTSLFDLEAELRAKVSAERLAEIKNEIVRIGNDGTQQGVEFAQAMFAHYPELRNA